MTKLEEIKTSIGDLEPKDREHLINWMEEISFASEKLQFIDEQSRKELKETLLEADRSPSRAFTEEDWNSLLKVSSDIRKRKVSPDAPAGS